MIPPESELVKHGDLVRLEHITTRRNLHSHKEIAPISKKHYQVTGYGEVRWFQPMWLWRCFRFYYWAYFLFASQNGTGDANDVWKVLITNGRDGDVVETVTSKLKFVHYLHHCVLTCSGKTLPKWLVAIKITLNLNLSRKTKFSIVWSIFNLSRGYSQQEVSCNPNMRDKNGLWNIEDNQYAKCKRVTQAIEFIINS